MAAAAPDAPTELTLAELVEANARLVACFAQLRAERDRYRTRLARLVALLERDPVCRKRLLRELCAHDYRGAS